MSYIKLAKIEDTPDFIDAAKSMGWDETNYGDVLNEIGTEDGYIVNYDVEKKRPRGEYGEVEVFFTIGSSEGNRWYSAGNVAVIINASGVWAKLDTIDEICC